MLPNILRIVNKLKMNINIKLKLIIVKVDRFIRDKNL